MQAIPYSARSCLMLISVDAYGLETLPSGAVPLKQAPVSEVHAAPAPSSNLALHHASNQGTLYTLRWKLIDKPGGFS